MLNKIERKAEHFSRNNGPVLIFNTYMFRHWNCFLSSVVRDGKQRDIDWNRSRLKTSRKLFQVIMLKAYKNHQTIIVMVIAPWCFVWYFLHNSNRSILECVGENVIRTKLIQPRPQGFSLKKWVGPTHFLREKSWGRDWNWPKMVLVT